MQSHATAHASRSTITRAPRAGVLALAGYGVRVGVERRQLAVSDGIGRERRAFKLARATCGLTRLVMLGHTGYITFEALRWLHDVGAAFVQIDGDGTVITVSAPPKLNDARLRRAQALALFNGVGARVARALLRDKLAGQLRVAERLPDVDGDTRRVIQAASNALDSTERPDRLRYFEADAASAYWRAWANVAVRFARKDDLRIPEHWRTFGRRGSPLTGAPRLAANPANALLNYCYAILEAECRIAVLTMGLDPGMGVLHVDQPARDSLALDVMEAVRPDVDADMLAMLTDRTFAARDFAETRGGVCRVLPPLTQQLAEYANRWRALVAPVAERVAQMFAQSPLPMNAQPTHRPTVRVATPLTQSARSAGREALRRKPKSAALPRPPARMNGCRMCGVIIAESDRLYCDDCLPEVRAESAEAFAEVGLPALARLRKEGRDPAHGHQAAKRRAATLLKNQSAIAAWEGAPADADEATFRRDILPALQALPLSAIMRASGLSIRYCSLIRRGLVVPHPRHWQVLASVGGVAVRQSHLSKHQRLAHGKELPISGVPRADRGNTVSSRTPLANR